MKHQEKKYRVESLAAIRKKLHEVGAEEGKEVVSTHYYAWHKGSDVVKLVAYSDRSEIHILEESKGKFLLKETVSVKDTKAGLAWLKDRGHTIVGVVRITQTDYEYKGGIVGLYRIDDFLRSVILDFPEGKHVEVEKELGLTSAEVISVPYNICLIYLEQVGRLRSMELG